MIDSDTIDSDTQVEYVKNGGNRCPFCKSENIEGIHAPNIDSGYCWQEIYCCDCEKSWQDLYTLTGFQKEGE